MPPSRSQDRSVLVDSIQSGIGFLLDMQGPDGAWRDFWLEPGQSDSWVTAYIGWSLCLVSSAIVIPLNRRLQSAVRRAVGWIKMAMRDDHSWGYNSRTPPDSDTTAHAVLLLHSVGEVLDGCYGRLILFQQADGGIATFTRRDTRDSWGMSHPDVSAVALQALNTGLPTNHPAMQLGLAYVLSQLGIDGLWQSFWWTTPLYSTMVNVRFLESVGVQYEHHRVVQGVLRAPVGDCIFPNALLGELLAILAPGHPRASEAQRYLLESQLPDGSWNSCPMLRVTSPQVTRPWTIHDDLGVVAADMHRLFTTATAVRSLAILDWHLRQLPSSRRS